MKKNLDSLSGAKSGDKTTPAVEEVKPQETPAAEPAKPEETKPAEPQSAPSPEAASPATPSNSDSFDELFPEPRVALGAPPSWLWWALLLIVISVLGVVGYALTQRNLKNWLSTDPSPTPTVAASATPTPTNTATPTPTPTDTPTPTPSPSGVNPASVTLRVLNGTSVNGAASKAKTILENAGFKVRTTGNAKSQNYDTTMVYYQAGREAEAEAVKNALTGYTVTLQQDATAAPDMVLVVIGRK